MGTRESGHDSFVPIPLSIRLGKPEVTLSSKLKARGVRLLLPTIQGNLRAGVPITSASGDGCHFHHLHLLHAHLVDPLAVHVDDLDLKTAHGECFALTW